jgi:SpoVK/Ycf46/Vps4 family AAA+-type ATPase
VSSTGILETLRGEIYLAPSSSLTNGISLMNTDSRPSLVGCQFECHLSRLLRGTLIPYVNSSSSAAGTSKSILNVQGFTGIIIQGPSGSGKTSLVCRLGYECREHFKFLSLSCSELVHKVVGDSERYIRDLLENIDTLLGQSLDRSVRGNSSARTSDHALDRMLSSFLVEIDGITHGNRTYSENSSDMIDDNSHGISKPVIVVATTQNIACIDAALLRPGRLEEHVYLTLPSTEDMKLLVESFMEDLNIIDVSYSSEKYSDLLDNLVLLIGRR